MDKSQKQQLINTVTDVFRNRQWFNGAGYINETLVIAYNYYPAFEIKEIKETMIKVGVQYEMQDIRNVMPGSQRDDVPSHVRQ